MIGGVKATYMHVLVPFTAEEGGDRAVNYAIDFFGTVPEITITAVHFTENPENASAQLREKNITERAAAADVSLDVVVQSLKHGDHSKTPLRAAIVDTVRERDVDTVVLVHEEKTALQNLLHTTTAERLLTDIEIPVVLVP